MENSEFGQLVVGKWLKNDHRIVNMVHDVYRDVLKTKLIHPIIEKCPPDDRATRCICIQQDGAKAHIYNDDMGFLAELQAKGLNTELVTQPANLPDSNLLDLVFPCGSICQQRSSQRR